MEALRNLLIVLGAYLLGGIPFSYLAGRLARGVDLRELGSGNLGATNVFRQIGPAWGVAVFLLDLAKGWLAAAIAAFLVGPGLVPVLAGLAAILGHSLTPYLRFRGGKGVATSAGVFLYLAPSATGVAFLVFLVVAMTIRIVSVGSLAAALALPIAVRLLQPGEYWLFWFTLLVALWVWIRHRSNLARLFRGEEPRFSLSREGGD